MKHNLQRGRGPAERIVEQIDSGQEYLDALILLVDFFAEVDGSGQELRYPILRDGSEPPIHTGTEGISLRAVKDLVEKANMLVYTADILDAEESWRESW